MYGTAVISPCGQFRYRLERIWEAEPETRRVLWVMINPSTADALAPDPTITRCLGFSKREGFGQLSVVNLYAFRCKDVALLRSRLVPQGRLTRRYFDHARAESAMSGPDNDQWIREEAACADLIIGGWGPKPWCLHRVNYVVETLLRSYDIHCLHVCGNGAPGHPLMLRADAPLKLWKPART